MDREVLTLDEEMMRRWGRTNLGRGRPGNNEEICALCGERLGDHYGQRVEVCPRDP